MSVTPAKAAQHLLQLRKMRASFKGFVEALYPEFTLQPFQLELIDVLDKLERGELTNAKGRPVYRLLITMPPRHGKSWLATELFPAYYLAKKRGRDVLSCSYNIELAKRFGHACRENLKHPLVRQAFEIEIDPTKAAANDWHTTERGTYYATGVGGSTTGRPATLLVLDDPIKTRKEADSATQRNTVWSHYTSAMTTRKQPEPDGTQPIEIMILTRWHPDDPAGRVMELEEWKDGDWVHVNFPAITYTKSQVQTPRTMLPKDDPRYIADLKMENNARRRYVYLEQETPLWPERFPLEMLHRRKKLDEREFAALYMQQPFIKGGNLIKSTWMRTYEKAPECPTIIISADTAFKKGEDNDYSVLQVWGAAANGDICLLDQVRGKWSFPELKRVAISLNAVWRGRGLRGFYIEDKASGQSLIQELRTQSGIAVIAHKISGDKEARINAVLPLIEGGRVLIPQSAPWLDAFLDECQQFPSASHDDQVDALAIGLDVMSRLAGSNLDFSMGTVSLENSLLREVGRQFSQLSPSSFGKHSAFPGWGE